MFSTGHHRILSAITRLGPKSRTDLARLLGLSKGSISIFVRDLLEQGILKEQELIFSQGRPSVTLGLRSDAASFIGISLHTDPATIVLTDPHGEVLARHQIPRETDPERCFSLLAEAVQKVRRHAEPNIGLTTGIGVAQPGFVSRDRRICLASAALGWRNVDVASELSELTGLPVFVENDTNALILGEQLFGASGECPNFSLVFVGDGIGSTHIIDNRLYRGHHGGAGELAHSPVAFDLQNALPCRCGNRGCLETLASLQSIRGAARSAGLPSEIPELIGLANTGDPDALRILHRAGSALGFGLAQLVQILDPSQVVVLMDAALKDSVFSNVLRQEMEAHVLKRPGTQSTLILRSASNDSFALGAASIAAQHFLFGIDWI